MEVTEIIKTVLQSHYPTLTRIERDGIHIIKAPSQDEGFEITQKFLSSVVDKKTILFLSGGKTPKQLYASLAEESKLHSGSVALVDERYGEKFHGDSNEKMIKDSGLYRYLELSNVAFYPILQNGLSREETAQEYDQTLRGLFSTFPKSVAILGIGMDGHTAGLPAQSSKFKIQNSKLFEDKYSLVIEFNDISGFYGERITLTFLGLSMIDLLLVLVFGKEKKEALKLFFSDGPIEEVPSRFLRKPEISKKTVLITDQEV